MSIEKTITNIKNELIHIISETNGISLNDTLELLSFSQNLKDDKTAKDLIQDFIHENAAFYLDNTSIDTLLNHPVGVAFFQFFKAFPLTYHEEHIHLTGSLSSEFIYPRIKKLLSGKDKKLYENKIKEVYGEDSLPINSVEDVENLIVLKDGELFSTYLRILYLAKLILISKQDHEDASYHMASELFHKYNVGSLRLKFTLSRASTNSKDQIPGTENLSEEDVVIGLFNGFKKFQKEVPQFSFILSPCFRKEEDFYDSSRFKNKKEHFLEQINSILKLKEDHPELDPYISEVDTVGDEKDLYRKKHFIQMRSGLRKLQYYGIRIRSHHGETWKCLRKGIQSVDNAMNIWHINTLEHGLSLGVNPNYYFHRLYQRVMNKNHEGEKIPVHSAEGMELEDMEWEDLAVLEKILNGITLTPKEIRTFLKTKFHTAREIEHYQHDVLNRMINKKVSLVALPSSNKKLTECFPDYKDHPFSWWEKKGVSLGIGTDNYITLNTNYIKELLILLFSDPGNLKITKLLMVATKEMRRPFISHQLWEMRKKTN